MMKFLFLVSLVFATTTYASSYSSCLTHGDCHDSLGTEDATQCLKIVTGLDVSGEPTCTLRCFGVKRSYQCVKVATNLAYGVCVREPVISQTLNPTSPDCSDALEIQ